MVHRYVLHNDDIVEASASVFSAGQVGVLSGWGVFSTVRVTRGIPFAFERHFARMQRDAVTLRVPFPPEAEYVRSRLMRLIEANSAFEATLRVAVVRNRGGIWEGPGSRDFDLVALTSNLKAWGAGVKLAVAEQARHAGSRLRGVKMLSWAQNLVLLEEAQCRGFDEVILLNERGEVSECTSANIFAAFGAEVLTPPLDSGCLPGVTREILLHEVHANGIAVVERPFDAAALARAGEVFITSTTRDLLPVLEIEGRSAGRSGEARRKLQAAFSAYVERYVAQREHQAVPEI